MDNIINSDDTVTKEAADNKHRLEALGNGRYRVYFCADEQDYELLPLFVRGLDRNHSKTHSKLTVVGEYGLDLFIMGHPHYLRRVEQAGFPVVWADGEGWVQFKDSDFDRVAVLVPFRMKRRMSPASLANLRQRLEKARAMRKRSDS